MKLVAALVSLAALGLVDKAAAFTGTFSENLPFDGPNPNKVIFNLYTPPKVNSNAPLVVAAHCCGWNGRMAFEAWQDFVVYADTYNFPIIFPSSPWTGDHCWDVGGNGTLHHNAGGDSQGIVSMVKYVSAKYNSDLSRIFVTGYSSGGMMTQVLVGAYPDVFAAGAEVSGVPLGCWASWDGSPGQWQNDCAMGQITKTGAVWAKLVTDAYPGYSGYRPKLQLYHGTSDVRINYINFGESIKQWTSVFGISTTPSQTILNTPKADWTKSVYGKGELEAYSIKGMDHQVPFPSDNIAKFFDLTCHAGGSSCFHRGSSPATTSPTPTSSGPAPTTSGPAPTTTQPTPTTTTAAPNGAKLWGQCGGIGWTGPTTCSEGKCVKSNDWYSQCQ